MLILIIEIFLRFFFVLFELFLVSSGEFTGGSQARAYPKAECIYVLSSVCSMGVDDLIVGHELVFINTCDPTPTEANFAKDVCAGCGEVKRHILR